MYLNNYYYSHLCSTIAGINIGYQLTYRPTNYMLPFNLSCFSLLQPFIQHVWNAMDGHGDFPLHLS